MIETDAEVQLHFLVYANHSIMNTKIRITGRENNFSDVAEYGSMSIIRTWTAMVWISFNTIAFAKTDVFISADLVFH